VGATAAEWREVGAQIAEVEEAIDAAQQVIARSLSCTCPIWPT